MTSHRRFRLASLACLLVISAFGISAPVGPNPNACLDDDRDGDGIVDVFDNCPEVANAEQGDCDADGRGDACESEVLTTGNLGGFTVGAATGTLRGVGPTLWPVVVTVRAVGDLGARGTSVSLSLAGVEVAGDLLAAGGSSCPATPDEATVPLTAEQWNELVAVSPAGTMAVAVAGHAELQANECATAFTEVTVTLAIAADCDGNGTIDSCDLADGTLTDCDGDGVPDLCAIEDGVAIDVDGDDEPDSCERARGDLDLDGIVGSSDLSLLLSMWGRVNPAFGDFDGDGLIGAGDLAFLLSRWSGPPPQFSAVTPDSGPAEGGTEITVTGTNLDSARSIRIGGNRATGLVQLSPTAIRAIVPAGEPGPVSVSVTTPSGTATLANGFTYIANLTAPVVNTVVPSQGPTAGATAITITGTGFIGATVVKVGTKVATALTVTDANTITAITPENTSGAKSVSVTTPSGTGSKANAFTYFAPPAITSIVPAAGPIAGGTTITINGSSLSGTTSLTIGGTPAIAVTVLSASKVRAVTPAGTAGAKDVVLTTPWGTVTRTNGFTYASPPTISAVSPNVGMSTGGTAITITGTNLTGATSVKVGTKVATGVTVVSPTKITATTPANTVGPKSMSVTTPGGVAILTNGFTYFAPPTITSVAPAAGPIAGGATITIQGTNLTGTSFVTVGGVSALGVAVVSSTKVTAVTPPGSAGANDVVLSTPWGTATRSNAFTYASPPTVTAVSPGVGPITGGTLITVTGTNLSGATAVKLGTKAANSVTVVSPTMLTAVTPAHTAGVKSLTVTTPGGLASLPGAFTYRTPPSLGTVFPPAGSVEGGTAIEITGSGFSGATAVSIGGVPVGSFSVVSDSRIEAVTSAGPVGPKAVVVTAPGGTATKPDGFKHLEWGITVLEYLPDPEWVYDENQRAAIIATGLPWRVIDDASQIEMLLVPPGSFAMGCSPSDESLCDPWEYPVHPVTVTGAFYLGRYEVTQSQWMSVMEGNPSVFPRPMPDSPWEGPEFYPVENVSWGMVQGFNAATGLRLPTEAEWEYACRAGTTTAYHSDSWIYLNGHNDDAAMLLRGIYWLDTEPWGRPFYIGFWSWNSLGFHDMSGNVWEWVSDLWSETYYETSPSLDPSGPSDGPGHVARGGAFDLPVTYGRSSSRVWFPDHGPAAASSSNGFRAAWTPVWDGPAIGAIHPPTGIASGGTVIRIMGSNLIGVSEITIGGTPVTEVTHVSANEVTAVTPAGSVGTQDVTLTTPWGAATLEDGFRYLPTGVAVLEFLPDPAVVTNDALRADIVATGLPWRIRDNASQIEMLLVPPGSYQRGCLMGSDFVPECNGAELPVHWVTLTRPFYLGRYETQQSEWQAVMGSNPSAFQGASFPNAVNHPVETVSWLDVEAFNGATGLRFVTEAEWEFACRAGTLTPFHGFAGHPDGTTDDTLVAEIAWCSLNSPSGTKPVGLKLPNSLGFHDMLGNVQEWNYDRAMPGGAFPYSNQPQVDPFGPEVFPPYGDYICRVARGGYFETDISNCRVSGERPSYGETDAWYEHGFRAAKTPIYGPPQPATIDPAFGPDAGGTTIHIVGTNLAGTSSVTVGGVAATEVTVISETEVIAVTPAGAAGNATVTVTTPWGTGSLPAAFEYRAPIAPAWATVLEASPDPAVVTDPTLRAAIVATGLAWRVRDNVSQIEMLLIPPGTGPRYVEQLEEAFYLGRYEVTQSQWQSVMGNNPSVFQWVPNAANLPVETMTRATIDAFNVATGLRLPSGVEWKFACRAGTKTRFHSSPGYPDGTNKAGFVIDGVYVDALNQIAWNTTNSCTDPQCGPDCYSFDWCEETRQPRPVGLLYANALGLHDMLGNVFEWTSDVVEDSGYTWYVARGGSWSYSADECSADGFWWVWPPLDGSCCYSCDDSCNNNLGFRVARTP